MAAAFISVNNHQTRFYISGLFTTDKTWNAQPGLPGSFVKWPPGSFLKWPPGGFPAPPLIQPSLLPKLAGDRLKPHPVPLGEGWAIPVPGSLVSG